MIPNLVGGLAAGALNMIGQHQANKQNMKIANAQMAFQEASQDKAFNFSERMSNTSYQRGMADMRAAGLNPILAYGQGGATAPQGAAQSGASTRVDNIMGPAVGSALQAGQAIAQLDQIAAQTDQIRELTNLTRLDQDKRAAEIVSEYENPELRRAQAFQSRTGGNLNVERVPQVRADTRQSTAKAVGQEAENWRFHNYGPRGTIPDALASGEAIARRGINSPLGQSAGTRLSEIFGRLMETLR